MSKLDSDGQPNLGINYQKNVGKALNELIGICRGIVANDVINHDELIYLDTWLDEHKYLDKDGDYIDLVEEVREISKLKTIDLCDLEEFLEVVRDILEWRTDANLPFENEDIAVGRFIGLCRGLVADNVLDDSEIKMLHQWIVKCGELAEKWPISILRDQLNQVLVDGRISEEERKQLFLTLSKIIGGTIGETGAVSGASTQLIGDDVANVDFSGTTFCLTGKFIFGNRKVCKVELESRGALSHQDVKKATNFLVIGSLASRDWKNTTHGRKIEAAIKLQEEGHPILILQEEQWVKFLT